MNIKEKLVSLNERLDKLTIRSYFKVAYSKEEQDSIINEHKDIDDLILMRAYND